MKKQFSPAWIASTQPRKQRKYNYNAPLHTRHKFLSTHLSKDLRKKYGKRNLPLRKGDEVLVMRGSFKKKKAKVVSIDLKNLRVELEGMQRSKRDGTKVPVHFHPRSLMISSLVLDDKSRQSALERKASKSKITAAPKIKQKENKNASN